MKSIVILIVFLVVAAPAAAQEQLCLPELQQTAVERDPRTRQLALQESATERRVRNIDAERLPALTLVGQGHYQSEVPSVPIDQPGISIPEPPKSRYEARLDVEQLLYDGGRLSRERDVEEAHLRTELARITAELYPLRAEVNQAFFRALLLQERLDEIEALTEDLRARLTLLRAQVREGTALPGDTAVVRAELLGAEQKRSEALADRRAALSVLAELVGRPIRDDDVLVLPDLAPEVAHVRGAAEPSELEPEAPQEAPIVSREHPRYAVFEARREQLERQASLIEAQTLPRVSAFGEFGYGRPGLQQFTSDLHDYWLAGLRVRWQPWNWGTTKRDREILRIQQEIVDTEEAAFTDRLRRDVEDDVETMDRLRTTVATDDRIIALREQVERQASVQLAERAITPAEYVDIRTDLQEARLARQRHIVELAQARARFLTDLGIVLR